MKRSYESAATAKLTAPESSTGGRNYDAFRPPVLVRAPGVVDHEAPTNGAKRADAIRLVTALVEAA
jgi:hypothetical protein